MENGSQKVFVSIDLEGMEFLEKKYPDSSLAALNWYFKLLSGLLAENNAIVYERVENRLSMAFASPQDAFKAIVGISESIFSESWTDLGVLPFKITAHLGEVSAANTSQPGHLRALSLLRFASSGNVLLTKSFKDAIKEYSGNVRLREVGLVKLGDNFAEEMIYQVLFYSSGKKVATLLKDVRIESNFVRQQIDFTGRNSELDRILKLLSYSKNQILTVTGDRGVGKTRIALQTASELIADYPDGAFLVELSWLKDEALIPFIIAETLKAETDNYVRAPSSLERLKTLINTKKMILILDGLDRLAGVNEILKEIIPACPNLKVIVTAVENINIENTKIFKLENLKVPSEGEGFHVKMLESFPAVEFAVQAAYSSNVKINQEDEKLEGMVNICKKLHGNPYAIELFLANNINLELRAFPVTVEEAGGSLDSVIKYVLSKALNTEEKALLSVVSAFEPSFNILDAESLCSLANLQLTNIAKTCKSLYEKRIIFQIAVPDGAVRYCIKSYLRDYILSADQNAVKVNKGLNVRYLLQVAQKYVEEKDSIDKIKVKGMITRRHNNFRALFIEAFAVNDIEKISGFLPMVGYYWKSNFYIQEGQLWYERIVPLLRAKKDKKKLLQVNLERAWMFQVQENKDGFKRLIKEISETAKPEEFLEEYVKCMSLLGWNNSLEGNSEESLKYFSKELECADKIKNPRLLSEIFMDMAQYHQKKGELEQEIEYFEKAKNVLRDSRLIYSGNYIHILNIFIREYLKAGLFEKCIIVAEELKEISLQLNDKNETANAFRTFGFVERQRGLCSEALPYFYEALRYYK
ncbi:MAG: NB-ARC domain-containing protein, partial [Candidatus Firestonebacteria bacterium]